MWARTVEVMIAVWLCISPLVFHRGDAQSLEWGIEPIAAAIVILLSLFAFYRPTRGAHLLILVVAAWLVLEGFLMSGAEASPRGQNQLMVGLLLAMFAICPTEGDEPPLGWRRFRGEGVDCPV